MATYFDNLVVQLYFLYTLNMHVKFHFNKMFLLFNLQTYFLYIILNYKNLKLNILLMT